MISPAAVFAAVAVTLTLGHYAGGYWVQTGGQAAAKGRPGWHGRRACAAHVATYTLTLAAFLAAAWWQLNLPLAAARVTAGLAVSAVTHYAADRRRPLEQLAGWLGRRVVPGKLAFYRSGDGLASGAAHLDQAWHLACLFAAALVIAGQGVIR